MSNQWYVDQREVRPLEKFYAEYFENWHKAEATATRLRGLLKRVQAYIDWLEDLDDDSPFDVRTLEKELAEELGDGIE